MYKQYKEECVLKDIKRLGEKIKTLHFETGQKRSAQWVSSQRSYGLRKKLKANAELGFFSKAVWSADTRNKQAELYEAIVLKKDNVQELLDKYEDIIDYNIQIGTDKGCSHYELQPETDDAEEYKAIIESGHCKHLSADNSPNVVISKRLSHFAAECGNIDALRHLSAKKCKMDMETLPDHLCPLHFAISRGHLDVMKLLLEMKCYRQGAHFRASPLLQVVKTEKLDVIEHVLQFFKADDESLLYGIQWCSLDVSKLLIGASSDLNCKDRYGNTPLVHSIINGDVEKAMLLINSGADANMGRLTPLFEAARIKSFDIVDNLIKHGADLTRTESDGSNVLHVSTFDYGGDLKTVQCLIDAGVPIEQLDSNGFSPLFISVWTGTPGITKCLLASGAEVNNIDKHCRTPFYIAASLNLTKSMEVLLEYGADPDIGNDVSATALWDAVFENNTELLKRLIEANANLETCSRGRHKDTNLTRSCGPLGYACPTPVTPMWLCVAKKHCEAALILLEAGYDIYNENWESLPLPKTRGTNARLSAFLDVYALHSIIEECATNAPTLQWLCRRTLRKSLGCKLRKCIASEYVPTLIGKYLSCENITPFSMTSNGITFDVK